MNGRFKSLVCNVNMYHGNAVYRIGALFVHLFIHICDKLD